ncbi:ring-opening amidohydrolase [Rhizobium sp. BK376]|uniref:cyanuric acid amidohydrolase n=1 Tax=Rhizobium sp. BK376 TaxID=2512149 RepID=UPI001047940A|nr:ring-opening amidohydrolase [Rhizobium sp. BK376]TCR69559.1 cyanuric acid amidohydrolase [Rhizobium sp. BK376]
MPSMRAVVYRVAAAGPDDVSGVEALLQNGLDPKSVVAVFGKTEGNGCVNDFTRGFATKSFEALFARYGAPSASIVMSGGTEGGLSPHWTIFARSEVPEDAGRALAIGTARTDDLPVELLGRVGQVEMVAAGVHKAIADAGIDNPADIHFVQIKCPLTTLARANEAAARGETPITRDTLKSMGYSRGASALGAAVALGELDLEDIADADICNRFELYSDRASVSSGVELRDHEIIVLGMSSRWSGPLSIDHAVMADAIDTQAVRAALSRLPAGSITAVLAKAEADPAGMIRGNRHTMLDDSDISSTRHARAFVGGVLAGVVGMTDIYVSGGAEHQGPPGGGPVSIIVQRAG